ncbi:CoA transferase [Nocardioides marmoriginsengisoli]|uniref:CoA transferase n=1 Tax=Nocardioides marmoriginsengisoli TaxID=661483 RepID=A0A3N0CGL7_9ACTN|nr:CoA transferase [Nocardioides marmoriginsengisoli]RNL62371.1 CoA transferase [Nocardioides marmoriginsengisoli]
MGVMSGIRVVELATWGFVPSAGVALADWGAQVIKVEHPGHGDPMRGLVPSSLKAAGPDAVSFMFQTFSRGKQSVGLDLKDPGARDALLRLVSTADVFLTNYLPGVRAKLGIDVDDLRAVNPDLVYVRGSGLGPAGEEADSGGFDLASYWSRGGLAHASTQPGDAWPPSLPGSAFGDLQAGLYAAGGVAAALLERERTGVARVVDVSLLGAAAWCTAPHIAASSLYDLDMMPMRQHPDASNPITNTYRTADDRFVALVMLESDRFWAPLMTLAGREDLATDPRFATAEARATHSTVCVAALDALFAERPLAAWTELLAQQQGVWAVVQSPREVSTDPQVVANGYVQDLQITPATSMKVVSTPTQFDGEQPAPTPAPELGADTEVLLLEAGLEWDDIIALKDRGAIT